MGRKRLFVAVGEVYGRLSIEFELPIRKRSGGGKTGKRWPGSRRAT